MKIETHLDAPAPRPGALPLVQVLSAVFAYQSGAALATKLFIVFGPLGTASLRIGLAALILLVLRRPWRRPVPMNALGAILSYGLTLGIMNMAFYVSLARLPLGTAVGIEFAGPLGLALLQTRRLRHLGFVALAVLGLLLLGTGGGIGARRPDPVGVGFALLAALSWATYIVSAKRLSRTMEGGDGVALGMAVAALVALPIGAFSLGPLLLRPVLLVPAFGVAVLSSALPYALELSAMRRLTTRTFSILMSLDPAIAAISGAVFLNQRLDFGELLGIACISAASIGTVLDQGRKLHGANTAVAL
jgi:inner membrane transporter RhtA